MLAAGAVPIFYHLPDACPVRSGRPDEPELGVAVARRASRREQLIGTTADESPTPTTPAWGRSFSRSTT